MLAESHEFGVAEGGWGLRQSVRLRVLSTLPKFSADPSVSPLQIVSLDDLVPKSFVLTKIWLKRVSD